jgi:hypothetical protein
VEFSVGADSMMPDIGILFNYLGIPGGQPIHSSSKVAAGPLDLPLRPFPEYTIAFAHVLAMRLESYIGT